MIHLTQAEYDEVKARGGEILFPQYMLLIADDNIHPPTSELLIGGEMADWAVQAIEAGEPWTMWATITKAGTTVTVTFALRPGESLTDLADLYADYGGAATCPHFGFEAFGGIAAAVLDGAAGTVTLTLNSATATWLRFAMQRQDVSGPGTKDAAGLGYGAHRTTLRSTQTRPSQLYPGKTLRRCPPSFSGTFSGDVFSFGPT